MKTAETSLVLTTNQVAALLQVTPRHILTLTNRGVLKPIKLGRSVRFLRRSVEEAMARLELSHRVP